jgi:uncharacterized membrane protein YeaQ/YmgE (transglycosylase-associated protein family)
MWNLLISAGIGLLAGAVAWLMFPPRKTKHILGSLILGASGGFAGDLVSELCWPDRVGELHSGSLILSAIGAVVAIQIWTGFSYALEIGGRKGAKR